MHRLAGGAERGRSPGLAFVMALSASLRNFFHFTRTAHLHLLVPFGAEIALVKGFTVFVFSFVLSCHPFDPQCKYKLTLDRFADQGQHSPAGQGNTLRHTAQQPAPLTAALVAISVPFHWVVD